MKKFNEDEIESLEAYDFEDIGDGYVFRHLAEEITVEIIKASDKQFIVRVEGNARGDIHTTYETHNDFEQMIYHIACDVLWLIY